MKRNTGFWSFAMAFAAGVSLSAAERVNEHSTQTTTTTTTHTVITETVVKEKSKVKWSPFKVCVLDFTTIDIKGQKRFLDEKNNPIIIPAQSTLTDADRKSMNSVMQGFVRMIDAWDNTRTNSVNRITQVDDNKFSRAKALDLYNTTVKGEVRPAVIGADYLSAYLSRYNEVFSCVDASAVSRAMTKLQNEPDFPRDFMLRLAQETGATHLIYGTVSDIRTQTKAFKGYGIETRSVNYQLDVIIKMVDLAAQGTVYGNVYTGNYREQLPVSDAPLNNNIFQTLMTSALEQAAEDLYDNCRPGRKNKITVTPLPFAVTVVPSGGMFFKPAEAEVFVDGVRAGSGGETFLVPAGTHTIEIKAAGYKTSTMEVNVSADQTIKSRLEK